MNDDKILAKLTEHDGQFTKMNAKLVDHDQQFVEIKTKLADHDQQFDRVINMLVDHDGRLDRIEENMATKADLVELKSSLGNTLDKILALVDKKDQELTIATHDMIKLEKRVDTHDRQIGKLAVVAGVTV